MESGLGKHMSIKSMLFSSIPAILMMVAISIYSVVDGFFVSNFAGKTAFAAVNLIYPFIMVLSSIGFMMGTGGAALVSKRLGEHKLEEANNAFTNCVLFTVIIGLFFSTVSFFFLPQIALLLGSDEEMLPYCVDYGRILILGVTFFNLQNLFQSFFQAAEKGRFGFIVTLGAGIINVLLDALFIVVFKMGIIGAAIGTVTGQVFGAVIPSIYFLRKNGSPLQLKPSPFSFRDVGRMSSNGMSEFATNISASVVSILLNAQLMRFYGQNGVGAYGIICYVWMIFAACFIGLNVSVAPRISYSLGAGNKEEMKSLYGKSLLILLGFGLFQWAFSFSLTIPISHAFAGYDDSLRQLTAHANFIYSLVYFFLGFNMFGSAFFTALNNGVISLLLSIVRLGIMECLCVILLPLAAGEDGIWWSVPLAEGMGTIMNLAVMFAFGNKYGYRILKRKRKEDEKHAEVD